jgi:signal transduction histidine kinase
LVLGGYLELLTAQDEHPNPMMQSHLLAEAITSHEELVSLVNQVVEATTMTKEHLSVHAEAISVRRVVQEVLADLNPVDAQAYTIRLQIAEQVMVWADPQYLRQVIGHLLSNVFKYVPKQTQISIETSQPNPSSPVCLSVQDAGPGIPPEEMPLLFEKCVRLKRDLAGSTPGMGLGLFICKHLVGAMGGCIWVESSGRMGEGSRFCLTLPPSLLPPVSSAGSQSPGNSGQSRSDLDEHESRMPHMHLRIHDILTSVGIGS